MKQDKFMTILAYLFGICGALALTTGKFIMGGVMIAVGVGIFWIRGTGKFNERSQYEKIAKTYGLTIADVYDRIKDMNTPLGKPWLAHHRGYPGDSIILGPNQFKDMITISISEKKPEFSVKHINKIENIQITKKEDEARFNKLIRLDEMDVNPKSYAEFAAYKLICSVLLDHIIRIIEKMTAEIPQEIPGELDRYNLYYFNNKEGFVKDMDGANYMKMEGVYDPFTSKVFDCEDNEMTSIVPRAYDKKGRVIDKAGYDMYSENEHYADISRKVSFKHDVFEIVSGRDIFTAQNFAAVQRANIKSNYFIMKDDEIKAIIAGNPNLDFEDLGICKQFLILSYDDDYLVLYASFINFLMTLNNFIK